MSSQKKKWEIIKLVSDIEHLLCRTRTIEFIRRFTPPAVLGTFFTGNELFQSKKEVETLLKDNQQAIRQRADRVICHITCIECGGEEIDWPEPAARFHTKSNDERHEIFKKWVKQYPYVLISWLWEMGNMLRWVNLGWVFFEKPATDQQTNFKKRWRVYFENDTANLLHSLFILKYTES